jgi:DNA-binding CsgD family transcriptional regulator
MFLSLYSVLILSTISSAYSNDKVLIIKDTVDEYNAISYLSYFDDEQGKLNTATIKFQNFKNIKKKRAIWGEKNIPFWFKLTLFNATTSPQDIVFDIAYENINRADFYTLSAEDTVLQHQLTIGNTIDFELWPIKNRHCPIPFRIKSKEKVICFFRIKCSREVQFPLTVRKYHSYLENELRQRYILGMYTGFFLLIIIVNSFFFFSFKDKVYIWYILLCATIGISVLTFEGLHIPLLLRYSKWLAINLDLFNALLGLIISFLFVYNFLDLKTHTPFIFYLLTFNCILTVLCVAFYLITQIHILFISEYVILSVSFLIYLIAGIMIMRKGYAHATTFVVAYSIIMISIITWVISDYFIDISIGIRSESEMMIGSIIEMIVLSYALSIRMKQLREENIRIRNMLITYVTEIKELRNLVDDKTENEDIRDEKTLVDKWNLTEREIDVLKLISYGFTNAEIADRLFISVNTVKYHTKNIYDKLQASSRIEALLKITTINAPI